MQFRKVNIEVTNICGLACSFCPPKNKPSKTIDLVFFKQILMQLKGKTNVLAFHVFGDPLTISNLSVYLEAAYENGFKVELTTSGYYLKKTSRETLFHPCVRQLNISLNSFNKNSLNISFDEYLNEVFSVCDYKLQYAPEAFINLRLWNIDKLLSEDEFNKNLFARISEHFNIKIESDEVYINKLKSLRIASKVILNFDSYFIWPSLESSHQSDGYCYGLQSHFGILADGTVVPCCMDGDGVIALGNLHEKSIDDIINSKRAKKMVEGFNTGIAVEELCKKCTYKDRFKI